MIKEKALKISENGQGRLHEKELNLKWKSGLGQSKKQKTCQGRRMAYSHLTFIKHF